MNFAMNMNGKLRGNEREPAYLPAPGSLVLYEPGAKP